MAEALWPLIISKGPFVSDSVFMYFRKARGFGAEEADIAACFEEAKSRS